MLHILDQIEQRAATAPHPTQACWVVWPDGEQSDHYYCGECVRNLSDYTQSIIVPQSGSYTPESGPENCAICGALLAYGLDDTDVRLELEHFETVDNISARAWREIGMLVEYAYSTGQWPRAAALLEKHGIDTDEC